jgi:hypothetical protein
MGDKPILTLDTSAINWLADDTGHEALIRGLGSGFSLRLTFTSINELIQDSEGKHRDCPWRVCKQLLASGDCLLPVGELLRKLVLQFENGSSTFEWGQIDARLGEAEEQALRGADAGDVLSDAVRLEAAACKKRFDAIYAKARPAFDRVFKGRPSARPGSVADLIGGLQRGGQYWKIARSLYDRLAGHAAEEGTVRKSWDSSPPFQCLMGALCTALYDRDVRPRNAPRPLEAEWADTFMAAYLPYCDQFVTADDAQLACYREVAQLHVPGLILRSWCDLRGALCVS